MPVKMSVPVASSTSLTAEIAEIADRHFASTWGPWCAEDDLPWPCDTARVLSLLAAAERRVTELEETAHEAAALVHDLRCGCSKPGWDTGVEHGIPESIHALLRDPEAVE